MGIVVDSCFSFVLRTYRRIIQHGHFDFPSLGLHSILESTSRLGRDGAPLEKDKVRVILLFEFLKPGVILAKERFCRYSRASSSRSGQGHVFGGWERFMST